MGLVHVENAHRHKAPPPAPQKVFAGDADSVSFEDLYERHYGAVFGYVLRTVMNRQVAEDITSETFFRAYRQFATYRPSRGTFSTWIFSIATNGLRDHFRKQRGVSPVDIADAELAGLLAHSSHGSNAEGALERLEAYRKLHETISLLKPNYRIAITLFYFEERSLRDIAQILGTMQSTVRWRLFRARALLAKQLNQSRGDLR